MRSFYKSNALRSKRSLFALFAATCLTHVASAEEVKDYLVVHMQDGSTVSYVLEESPTVTFEGSALLINSLSVSDEYEVADVNIFTFEKLSGISAVTDGEHRITVKNQQVLLEGFAPATDVRLTDVQGCIIRSCQIDANGTATISLSSLSSGVYVIYTSDGKSFKLIKQ